MNLSTLTYHLDLCRRRLKQIPKGPEYMAIHHLYEGMVHLNKELHKVAIELKILEIRKMQPAEDAPGRYEDECQKNEDDWREER